MICDSSLLIAHARNEAGATRFIAEHRAKLSVPFVVAAELMAGARRSRQPARELARTRRLLSLFPTEWPDDGTIEAFSVVLSELLSAGTPIGQHDTWIAALARQHSLPVATSDSDFQCVSGITVVGWTPSKAGPQRIP